MFEPYDERLMRCYPVSARIDHVANDDADCSAPDPSSVEIRNVTKQGIVLKRPRGMTR